MARISFYRHLQSGAKLAVSFLLRNGTLKRIPPSHHGVLKQRTPKIRIMFWGCKKNSSSPWRRHKKKQTLFMPSCIQWWQNVKKAQNWIINFLPFFQRSRVVEINSADWQSFGHSMINGFVPWIFIRQDHSSGLRVCHLTNLFSHVIYRVITFHYNALKIENKNNSAIFTDSTAAQ